MSSNHQSGSSNPLVPSGQCAAYVDLLPVLGEPETVASAVAGARAHLATCAYCRARMALYTQLDVAITRAMGPAATPRRRTEDIMRDILRGDATQAETTEKATDRSPLMPVGTAQPRGPRLPHLPPASRRRWSGLAPVAAVLAVALLAAVLFAGHGRGGHGTKATPAPDWNGPGSQTSLEGISMVSATEGWAIGSAFPANGTSGNQARPLLLHYKHGVWTSMRLSIPGQLSAISMVSASDGWAMGMQGLILHYDGTSWRQVATPTKGDFTQVRMFSARDGWAVGGAGGKRGLFHYDGHAWTGQWMGVNSSDASLASLSLTAIDMLSPTDGWAIGTVAAAGPGAPNVSNNPAAPTPAATVILRYHAGTWTVDDTLTNAGSQHDSLESIAMISANEGWAAGVISTQPTATNPTIQTKLLLLHDSGGAWHQVADPLAGSSYHASDFVQIAMRAADDGWVTASQNPAATVPVALHYDGTRWSVAALPDVPHSATWYLTGLAFTPAGDLWAIGARLSDATTGAPDGHGGFTPTITPLILHEQQGTWSVVMR